MPSQSAAVRATSLTRGAVFLFLGRSLVVGTTTLSAFAGLPGDTAAAATGTTTATITPAKTVSGLVAANKPLSAVVVPDENNIMLSSTPQTDSAAKRTPGEHHLLQQNRRATSNVDEPEVVTTEEDARQENSSSNNNHNINVPRLKPYDELFRNHDGGTEDDASDCDHDDSKDHDISSASDTSAFEDSGSQLVEVSFAEGCVNPAKMVSARSKNGKPKTGNKVASSAIDGDPETWWSVKGRKKWIEVDFEGGEGEGNKVQGVAIAFRRGDRRVAFLDLTLANEKGDVVVEMKDLESSGLTEDFENFYFDEPVEGSKLLVSVRGTTAGSWNSVTEISACLVPDTSPAPLPAPTVPPADTSGVTYVGCFLDDVTGATRFIGDAHTTDADLTPLTCATYCEGYKYMGLQFSQECFCGDTYFTAEQDPIPTDTCIMPCGGDEDITCGGPWTNSVYIVGDPAEETNEEIEAKNKVRVDDGIPRRKLTMVNNCEEQVRVGATGGFVKTLEDPVEETCPDGSVLDAAVGACFWGLPLPEDGKSYDLQHGGSLEVILDNAAMNGIRWSGNIWASTGCQRSVGCETATCLRNNGYPDGYCPPSTGPTGPVTKAEFTLVDTGVDYYDVTAIDGVNIPVEMKPDPASSPLEREDDYWCSNPGGTETMSTGLEGCSWEFDATNIDGFSNDDMTRYLRWVRNDGDFTDCKTDDDCRHLSGEGIGENLKCGTLFGMDALNGGVTTEKCGSSLGWHSANGICGSSASKPLGYFPNSYPFMCDVKTEQVKGDNSTQSQLYGCAGTFYGQSGYSKNSDETSCGCPMWEEEGIHAPSSSPCYSRNPYWDLLSLPWLKYLKAACPTAYCFPFDDHSSTFVCRNEDGVNTHVGLNSMSYVITFCPADSQARMLE